MKSSWVKSVEEIKKIEDRIARPVFQRARWLSVGYLTRPDIVRAVLPPPLKPADEPLVTVGIGTFGGSNCVGSLAGGLLAVAARYQNIDAGYCLAMPMSTDVAIIFGRELFGEPKKRGKVNLTSDGDLMSGTVERMGIPYLSVDANLIEEVPVTGPSSFGHFHFKFMHSANGRGLEFDPILVHAHFTNRLTLMRRGPGRIQFTPSHHDPLHEIEIVEMMGAVYVEGDFHAEATRIATVDAKEFMPYAFQNVDDYAAAIETAD